MNKGYLVISLLILNTLVSAAFFYTGSGEKAVDTVGLHDKFVGRRINSIAPMLKDNVLKENISLVRIYEAIKDYTAIYGGLKENSKQTDSFINSTFWGVLSLYLLEKIDNYIKDVGNLKEFLGYLYDEKTGGFRDWLEGDPNAVSTGFGILIKNITKINFQGFDSNKTIQFLENYLANNTNPDLVSLSMSGIALSILGYNTSNLTLTNDILSYFSNGHFEDPNVNMNVLVQTFFAVKALKYLDYNLSQISNSLEQYLLSLKKTGTFNGTDYSGFGVGENPTVFETGIVLDLLREIGYNVDSLRDNITNFLVICYSNGNFNATVNSKETGIYQIAGAMLSLFDLGEIYSHYKLSATIQAGDQIPIDLNVTEVELKVELETESVSYLAVSSNVTGRMVYDSQAKVYKGVMFPRNYTFGNYTMEFVFKPALRILSSFSGKYDKAYRIGYKLVINPGKTTLAPGENLTVNVDVTFNNGTYAENGTLVYKLGKGNLTIATGEIPLKNKTLVVNISIPSSAQLGDYGFEFQVNDTHGFDHTYGRIIVTVDDILVLNAIEGNKTTYHIGETIRANVSIIYNYSRAYIPRVKLEAYYLVNGKMYNGTAEWLNTTFIRVSTNVTNKLVKEPYLALKLKILWDTGKTSEIGLFVFNISTEDLVYEILGGTNIYIGDVVDAKVRLYSNTTNVSVADARMSMIIYKENITYQKITMYYNDTTGLYFSNTTLDPNIPAGTYNVNISIYDPTLGKTRYINSTSISIVNVLGYPEIDLATVEKIPESPKLGDIVIINFKVKVKGLETSNYLTGLKLLANITDGGETLTIYVGESNGTYTVSFKPENPAEFNITIFRESDKYVIYSFKINVAKVEPSLYDILEPYLLGGLWVASLSIAVIYFVARYLVGRKVSKRYLVKKVKKSKKAKKRRKK